MPKTICLYSSSSDAIAPEFFVAARALGEAIAAQRWDIIYGGGNVGLMGALAKGVHAGGGRVIGVIPEKLHQQPGITYEAADELIVTKDLRERKHIMDTRADAFISLPGGFGTLEETLEILTLKQLQYHARPVIFLNTNNFFAPLFAVFEHLYTHRFSKPEHADLYQIAATPTEAVTHIVEYQAPEAPAKWFHRQG